MEVQNYYLLLKLSVNPPEEDTQIIEEAIKKKQSEWSRNRNHPTKATQAQQYIGLLPEIQKVMLDPDLRKKEAEAAKQIILNQEKQAFEQIDRHISLLMSKGHITKAEIVLMAEFHETDVDRIKNRLKRKENYIKTDRQIMHWIKSDKLTDKNLAKLSKTSGIDLEKLKIRVEKNQRKKYQELDLYFDRCAQRGYVTTDEIRMLVPIYELKEDDIIRRVKCQIKTKAPETTVSAPPFDKTIEKLIADNLKIINKTSLYDFLGVSPTADLKSVKKRVKQKDAAVRQVGQKDAAVTASGVLSGQCLTIFKTEEGRKSYDESLVSSRMGELDTDLEVAGLNGKIVPQYFSQLVKNGIFLGMDAHAAIEYVEKYCQNKKWPIEKQKLSPEKKRLIILAGMGAAALLLVCVVLIMGMKTFKAVKLKAAYESALADAEKQPELEGKEVILNNFVRYSEPSEYIQQAEAKIKKIREKIQAREFKKMMALAEEASNAQNFEQAEEILKNYLKQYPKTPNKKEITQKLAGFSGQIDDREFSSLKAMSGKDYEKKVRAYDAYLEKFPQGSHVKEVKTMISDMLAGYFSVLKKDLAACDVKADWQKGVKLCSAFIEKFKGTSQADEALELKEKYENRIAREIEFVELKSSSAKKSADFEAARQIFIDYVEAHPEIASYFKEKIAAEIRIWDQKIAARDRMKKAWKDAIEFSELKKKPLTQRIKKMESFLKTYPATVHTKDAEEILANLKTNKNVEDERFQEKQAEQKWKKIQAYAQNTRNNLESRIQKLEQYINTNPKAVYLEKAGKILNRLNAQAQTKARQLQIYQENIQKRQQEKARVLAALNGLGRFSNNGDMVTDTRTGRMWCVLDGAFDQGRCLTYQQAQEYVNQLNTGGYRDWRMPSAAELETLLQTSPAFPANSTLWYWAVETFWHGWNKKAYIFKYQGQWLKDSSGVAQCGSVLAVR